MEKAMMVIDRAISFPNALKYRNYYSRNRN
jgi:hypothetical protein